MYTYACNIGRRFRNRASFLRHTNIHAKSRLLSSPKIVNSQVVSTIIITKISTLIVGKLYFSSKVAVVFNIMCSLSQRDHITPALQELAWKCVDDLICDNDTAVVRHLMTSANAPEILRNKFVLRSDEPTRYTYTCDRERCLNLPRVRTVAFSFFSREQAVEWSLACPMHPLVVF